MLFSVIMPTMWRKPHITIFLLQELSSSPFVDEIIIINNSKQTLPINHPKYKILNQEENIYVNPAWNLGVAESKNENIILCNDDILIPKNLLKVMMEVNFKEYGLIGISPESIQYNVDSFAQFENEQNYLKNCDIMNYGFGILMFCHKDNYNPIPDQMKVWCGDSYLFYKNQVNGKQNLNLSTKIKTEMSSTSSDPQFDQIKANDQVHFIHCINLSR